MTDAALSLESDLPPEEVTVRKGGGTLSRVLRYSLVRLVMLFVTVVIGIYLTILIANMGGYVDQIRLGEIRSRISMTVYMSEASEMKQKSSEEKKVIVDEQVALDLPFGYGSPS